jgi:hypothetical protein
VKTKVLQGWFAVALCVGIWLAPTAKADSGAWQRRAAVSISVYNDAGLNAGSLRRAEIEATAIFRTVGIETDWLNCSAAGTPGRHSGLKGCGRAEFPTRFVLRIVGRAQGLRADAFGVAFLAVDGSGAYCDVFLDPMRDLQQVYPASLEILLGHVAAHEIAHLLLGSNSHTPKGLMRAHWNHKQLDEMLHGALGFSEAQANTMAARLSTRSSHDGTIDSDSSFTVPTATGPAVAAVSTTHCPSESLSVLNVP